jgi:hypothetical protein
MVKLKGLMMSDNSFTVDIDDNLLVNPEEEAVS